MTADRISAIVRTCLQEGCLTDDAPWATFYDLDLLDRRLDQLEAAFPDGTLHAVAVKANPLSAVLNHVVGRGAGLEVASFGELRLALSAGCPPERIVFDSPAKTLAELRFALEHGVHVNADNLAEIERIASLRGDADRPPEKESRVGIRINPEVGAGAIETTSTGVRGSKFGVSLSAQRAELLEMFRRHPWIGGLHVHVGSQGCDLNLLVAGARKTQQLVEEIEAAAERALDFIDIGGGLPVRYRPEDRPPQIEEYAAALRDEVDGLFNWTIITEFGRWVHAPCAIAASRVEYVKPTAGRDVAVIHFGADFMLRRAYQPEKWFHALTVLDAHGRPKRGAERVYDVAGPLCFSGDLVAEEIRLPALVPGDIIVASDVGAYTFSMWSHYNSRAFPEVLAVRGDPPVLETIRPRDTPRDIQSFWS